MAETARESREQRTKTLTGAAFGLVLLLLCSGLLWREEARLPEGETGGQNGPSVLEIEADGTSGAVSPDRLVYLNGRLETADTLTDPLTGSSVQALGIRRVVEYFQWVEVLRPAAAATPESERKAEDFAYHQRWVPAPVDSAAFHSEQARRRYANMALVRLPAESRYARDVRLGIYRLPDGLTASLPAEEPFLITVPDSVRDDLNRQAAEAHRSAGRGAPLLSNMVHVQGGIIYIGAGGMPQNGDVRVVYSLIPSMRASLAGAVQGTDVTAWRGDGGREICRLLPGEQDVGDMLPELSLAGATPVSVIWFHRLASVLACACAFFLLLRPLRLAFGKQDACPGRVSRSWGGGSLLLGLLWTAAIVLWAAQGSGPGM